VVIVAVLWCGSVVVLRPVDAPAPGQILIDLSGRPV
jgi:hypothetical protein